MNDLEKYEALAEAFWRETGMIAPGKDLPEAWPETNEQYHARLEAWIAWLAKRRTARNKEANDVG